MRRKTVIILLLTMVCALISGGCGTEGTGENVASQGKTEHIADREYVQKEKNLPLIELAPGDVVEGYAKISGAVIEATYKGQKENLTVEADDGIEGGKTEVIFQRYSFTLNDIIRKNGDEAPKESFILGVNSMYSDVFPDLQEGDRVIIGVRKAEESFPDSDCYIWNDVSLFYIKGDGTIFSAYTEDNKYDGYRSESFKQFISEYQVSD